MYEKSTHVSRVILLVIELCEITNSEDSASGELVFAVAQRSTLGQEQGILNLSSMRGR